MDTAPSAATDQSDPNIGFMRMGIDVAGSKGMAALFDTINAAIPDLPEPAKYRKNLRYDLHAMDPVAFVRFGEELLVYPSFLEQLTNLTMPVTVIVGENVLGLRPYADAMAATIPGAVLRVIPNAAHTPQTENTAGWLAAVDEHFARQSAM